MTIDFRFFAFEVSRDSKTFGRGSRLAVDGSSGVPYCQCAGFGCTLCICMGVYQKVGDEFPSSGSPLWIVPETQKGCIKPKITNVPRWVINP